jgi:hypothetical protein
MSSSKEKLEALASFTSNLLASAAAEDLKETQEQTEAKTDNGMTDSSEMEKAELGNDSEAKMEVENTESNLDKVENGVDDKTDIQEDKNEPENDVDNETTQNDPENGTETETKPSNEQNVKTKNDAENVPSPNGEMQQHSQLEETLDLGEEIIEDDEMASQEVSQNGNTISEVDEMIRDDHFNVEKNDDQVEAKSLEESKTEENETTPMEVDSKSPVKSRPSTPMSPHDIEIEYKDEDDREWDSRPSSRAQSPKPKKVSCVALFGKKFLRLRIKKLSVPKKAFVGTDRVDLKILKQARPSLFRFEKSKVGRSHSAGEKKTAASARPRKDSNASKEKEKEKKKRKESTSSRDKPVKKEKKEPAKPTSKSKPEVSDSDSDSDAELKAMRAKILKKSTITNPLENNFISAKLAAPSSTSTSSDLKTKTSSSSISKPVTSSDKSSSDKKSSENKSSDKPRERNASEKSSDKKSSDKSVKVDVIPKKPSPRPIGPVVLKPFVILVEKLTEKQIDDYENGRIKFEPPKEVVKSEPPKAEERRSRSRSKSSRRSSISSKSSRRSSVSSRSSLSSSPVRRSR